MDVFNRLLAIPNEPATNISGLQFEFDDSNSRGSGRIVVYLVIVAATVMVRDVTIMEMM